LNLLKTSFFTSISTAVTFISGFIVTKVVAVKIGPAGVAYVGQFQNSIAVLALFSTFAITVGVVKYIAGNNNDRVKQQQVITTALSIILLGSFGVSLIVISGSVFFSKAIFHSSDFWAVYLMYGLFVGITALNSLFSAVLNGFKEIRNLTIVNIVSSLTGILFTVLFAYTLGVKGVLIASNFTALVVFCINIYFVRRLNWIRWKPSFRKWDKKMVKLLFAFTVMGLTSGFAVPAMQFFVRNKIITDFSLVDAGCWQAITRISDYYLAFITTVLSVYYLPRLSEIKNNADMRKEIMYGYKIILPAVGFLALLIWLCKVWVVHILFTADFLPMLPLFKYQLLGDFFKIGSWLVSYIMVAKALTKNFLVTEIVFSLSFVLFSYVLINRYGVIGATYAFCINYGIYWITMWLLMKKHFAKS
jgi:O-antigen/teichoic acid export membrane protein